MDLPTIISDLEARMPGGISSQQVELVYCDSLAEDLPANDPNFITVEGIVHTTAFDYRKLETHRREVAAMLSWLPGNFIDHNQGGGGGWSFLNACHDREDRQWTGLHWTMEMLVQLGIGLGMAEWLGPRELWPAFPQGMPYFKVTLPE